MLSAGLARSQRSVVGCSCPCGASPPVIGRSCALSPCPEEGSCDEAPCVPSQQGFSHCGPGFFGGCFVLVL